MLLLFFWKFSLCDQNPFNSINTLLMVLDPISPNSYWSIIFNLGGRELTATITDRRWSGQLIQTRIKNKCYPFHSDFE